MKTVQEVRRQVYGDAARMARQARIATIANAGVAQALEELHNTEITPGQRRGNALWVLEETAEAVRSETVRLDA